MLRSSPTPTRPVHLEVEPLEDRCVLSSSAFVTGLYENLLHRTPQSAEVAGWVAALNTGVSSPQQVALAFTTSPEYQTNLIQGDYQGLLGRTPSTQEVNGWLANLQHGLSDQQLVVSFLASPEYFQKHGNTTSGWLAGVYHDVLARMPDLAGKATWTTALQQGMSLAAVAQDIAGSPEALMRVVTAAYQQVLGRAPDPQGLATWTAALAGGVQPSELVALLATSPEFVNARGGLDPVQPLVVPVLVAVIPVVVPVDTFVFDPFLAVPFGGGGCGCTGIGFTGGGFTGGGFSGGSGSGS